MQKEITTDNLAQFLFHQGTNYRAYEYLGCRRESENIVFRVWAPNADSVYLVGDFNKWDESCPMKRITEKGVWEATLSINTPGLCEFSNYKYKLITKNGEVYKSDPYAFHFETPPATSSKIYDIEGYEWQDSCWLQYRQKHMTNFLKQPINIYELHVLSWRRHEDNSPLSYRELAEALPPYVKQMGYTHVELMPIMEHPYEGSWGYQVCGYYAPTSRLGTPKDFMFLVDKLHMAGIGVILDWVPAHFPKDEHGLYEFDGEPLYEYQGMDKMEFLSWGTRRFDVGRNEVECFLISNADFWVRKYHVDGLRIDAVASMLYLDYDKKPGEWFPNYKGDNRCLEAIYFFKKLNSYMLQEFPDVMMIAEESTAWKNVTHFDEEDGLGFTMKWNMGWMNDILNYAQTDPYFRKYNHNKMTFSLMYAFNERFLLPISHDEVVHGKKSFLDKMPGEYNAKFSGARLFFTYIMTHPGKKLTFMGNEIGQFTEWNYKNQIEWFLLEYEKHAKLQRFVCELNAFYLSHRELWQKDDSWEGFSWIDANNRDDSVLSFRRIADDGSEIIVLLNFTPVLRENFKIGVPRAGVYSEIFNSDEEKYGGEGIINSTPIHSFECKEEKVNNMDNALCLKLAPLGATILKMNRSLPTDMNI